MMKEKLLQIPGEKIVLCADNTVSQQSMIVAGCIAAGCGVPVIILANPLESEPFASVPNFYFGLDDPQLVALLMVKGILVVNRETPVYFPEEYVQIGKKAVEALSAEECEMTKVIAETRALSMEAIIKMLRTAGAPKELIRLAGNMIYLTGRASSFEDGELMASGALQSGRGFAMLRNIIESQNGDTDVINDYAKLI